MRLRKQRDDVGASAVLIAVSLLLLMGFAALAVDAGIVFSDRRQQQSAADVGALAAIQFAKTTLPSVTCGTVLSLSGADYAACRGAEEAMAVVNGTLPDRYSAADWLLCGDPSKPAEFTQESTISPCISFTANFQKARVLLPGTDVDTSFAALMGFSSVRVSAFAHAGVELKQSAEVWPFALGPSGTASSQVCILANSAKPLDVDPCDGPSEGNFGKLDIALYGNNKLGTPEICGNAMANTKLAVNLVVGADHAIVEITDPPTVDDFDNCAIFTIPVDHLYTQTGNSAGGLKNGLFSGISTPSYEGRLMCKDSFSSDEPSTFTPDISSSCELINNQIDDGGEGIDDTPLWEFITSYATTLTGDVCTTSISDRQLMETCLDAWNMASPDSAESLFTDSLKTSPRFGAVPILELDPGTGSGDFDVIEFRPIYLETIYLSCSAKRCDIVHSPGEPSLVDPCPNPLIPTTNSCGWPQVGNKKVYAMTAFMLELDMLHPDVREKFPAEEGTIVFNLSR